MLIMLIESILKIHLQVKLLLIVRFVELCNDTQANDYTINVLRT